VFPPEALLVPAPVLEVDRVKPLTFSDLLEVSVVDRSVVPMPLVVTPSWTPPVLALPEPVPPADLLQIKVLVPLAPIATWATRSLPPFLPFKKADFKS
jgi:hypothetical protein